MISLTSQYFQYLFKKVGAWYFFGITFLLFAVFFLLFTIMPQTNQYKTLQAEALQNTNDKSNNSNRIPQVSPASTFYQSLPPYSSIENKLGIIFETAEKNELIIDQVDYKLESIEKSAFSRYHISMPISGGYLNIRKFINQIMLKNPSLSLDHVTFDRQDSAESLVDANLDFSLYLMTDIK